MNNLFKRLKLTKTDAVLITALLLAGAALLLPRLKPAGAVTARVYVDGALVCETPLSAQTEPKELALENGVTVAVGPGGVCFACSDCAGQDCVRCGMLTRAGQMAACVPNRTLIVLEGAAGPDAPDAISY